MRRIFFISFFISSIFLLKGQNLVYGFSNNPDPFVRHNEALMYALLNAIEENQTNMHFNFSHEQTDNQNNIEDPLENNHERVGGGYLDCCFLGSEISPDGLEKVILELNPKEKGYTLNYNFNSVQETKIGSLKSTSEISLEILYSSDPNNDENKTRMVFILTSEYNPPFFYNKFAFNGAGQSSITK